MATIRTFQDLLVWKKSHELVLSVYAITQAFPKEEMFGLTSQLRRAVVSVPANIVEGFRRRTVKDSLHFYTIADGSLEEVKYHLYLSKDLKYISENEYEMVKVCAEEAGRLLTRWLQSQRKYV